MAVWQFDFYIVSKQNNLQTDNYDGEKILSWVGINIKSIDIHFLPKEKSWSEDIIQYGKIDETCIEFMLEDNVLQEIKCRLDLRNITKETLKSILGYIKEIDGVVYYSDGIYDPELNIIVELMKKSPANKFCENSRKFFDKIK